MTVMIIFICLAVLYSALKIILEKRLAPLDAVGEDGDLSDVAFSSGLSVYTLFQKAGTLWQFSHARIDNDFKTYLYTGHIPGYVRLFVKQQPAKTRDRTLSKLIYSGGRPPYL
ncbi:hypothetical protein [Desulfosarcina sp.]|jgi:hypothetical protein|uniref:hypothetical protein n=1 Tax=Desulfosarcina sp. TaxID=2027861 RepID=UPI003970EB2D